MNMYFDFCFLVVNYIIQNLISRYLNYLKFTIRLKSRKCFQYINGNEDRSNFNIIFFFLFISEILSFKIDYNIEHKH